MYIAGGTQVRKVDQNGIITTVAGGALNSFSYSGDGGSALNAGFLITDGVADSAGNIYLCDSINNRVRKVGLDGIINTVAGTGITGFSGDGGPATKAQIALPQGIVVDNKGNFFFADAANARIRKVDKNGIISTVAGSGSPLSLSFQDGGPALQAGMTPTWVTVDKAGNLYIGDTGGQKVRKVDTKGIITTYAGGGGPVPGLSGFSGDGGPAIKAQLNNPRTVVVDSARESLYRRYRQRSHPRSLLRCQRATRRRAQLHRRGCCEWRELRLGRHQSRRDRHHLRRQSHVENRHQSRTVAAASQAVGERLGDGEWHSGRDLCGG